MNDSELENSLRTNPHLTDELRADLWDLHAGNTDAVRHPVLRAIAVMAKMDPADLELLETHPQIFKLALGGKHANTKK